MATSFWWAEEWVKADSGAIRCRIATQSGWYSTSDRSKYDKCRVIRDLSHHCTHKTENGHKNENDRDVRCCGCGELVSPIGDYKRVPFIDSNDDSGLIE